MVSSRWMIAADLRLSGVSTESGLYAGSFVLYSGGHGSNDTPNESGFKHCINAGDLRCYQHCYRPIWLCA